MIHHKIQRVWDENPLGLILGLAILFRLIAVVFSKGYGMLDDHFLVIEAAQSWVDGYDYNRWLPGSGSTSPQGHSFFYVGIHYILLLLLEKIHLTDPQAKMYVIRLIHAAFSLLIVSYGYKITEKLADKHSARQVGLLMALLWFMPFMSVRNMVEVVCMPFLLWGTYLLISNREERKPGWVQYIWVGILFGIAFSCSTANSSKLLFLEPLISWPYS
ncbi:MAG: glycosyltransferase family 39 protein [Bacteroidota bacterium]|nr:glycosyltransferase family 39 protein [Bacteroidota bacterium]